MGVREVYLEWRENPQVRHSGGLGRGKGSQASATDGVRPSQLGEPPAAQRWPEVLGSEEGGWGRAARELCLPARRTGIFIAPVFLDLSPPGFMRSVAVACGGGGGRGEHVLLQGLILGLGALAGMEVSKSKQGAIWGNTAAERLLGAASAKQSAVRPGETRGFPTPLSVTFTAVVGGGGRQGKWIPPTQSPRGSGFPFLAALAQG